jgi:hypothetical protein
MSLFTPNPLPPYQTSDGLKPAPTKVACRAARVSDAAGATRSLRDEHALCRPRDATALSSQRWRRARAVRPMCVPSQVRHDRCGRAHAVPPTRHDRPPQPALADDTRRAARVCFTAGASRSRRDEHALCRPRNATIPPQGPSRRWRRVRAVRPVCVPPAA